MRAMLAVPLVAVPLVVAAPARSDEPDPGPLVFTVHPSGIAEGETLDQKLARRERSFRFICVGCQRVDGRVAEAPFRPFETLRASQLDAAVAAEANRSDER